jgi:hypothetical protein
MGETATVEGTREGMGTPRQPRNRSHSSCRETAQPITDLAGCRLCHMLAPIAWLMLACSAQYGSPCMCFKHPQIGGVAVGAGALRSFWWNVKKHLEEDRPFSVWLTKWQDQDRPYSALLSLANHVNCKRLEAGQLANPSTMFLV